MPKRQARDIASDHDLTGRTVVLTGGSSGLGAETAKSLAATGANVIVTARDMKAGQDTLAEMATLGCGRHLLFPLNLSSAEDVHRFADAVLDQVDSIDILIANAGVSETQQLRDANGFDLRFSTNHLGHFLLAHALLDAMSRNGSRIVMLGSSGHKGRPVTLDDLAWERREIDSRVAYGESKSLNSLFAVEATRRWHDRGIFANCVLPGSVITGLMRNHSEERLKEMYRIGGGDGPDSAWGTLGESASTCVWAALAPELDRVGALVLEDCGPCRVSGPGVHPWRGYELHSTDSETARRAWDATLALVESHAIPIRSE